MAFLSSYVIIEFVRVLREQQMISGFLYESPVSAMPAFTHCGEALCCSGYTLAPHRHAGFEFQYLCRGSYYWKAGNAIYKQEMGALFITWPGELHGSGEAPKVENQHIWMGLKLDDLGREGVRLSRRIRLEKVRVLTDCQESELLLRAIVRQVVETRPRRTETIRALVTAFIALVEQRIAGGGSGRPAALPYSACVQKALAYMRQHLDHRLSLREMAAAGMMRATTHFCTRFHQEVGVTPSVHHTQLRLEGAREALRQPSSSITNVALQFGFSSSQHFSDLFRRTYGVSPRRWKLGSANASHLPEKLSRTH